jgi:hypothetical protein
MNQTSTLPFFSPVLYTGGLTTIVTLNKAGPTNIKKIYNSSSGAYFHIYDSTYVDKSS